MEFAYIAFYQVQTTYVVPFFLFSFVVAELSVQFIVDVRVSVEHEELSSN